MFFTPRYGGHWVVTDGQAIREIYMDPDRFSATVSQSVDPDLRGSRRSSMPTPWRSSSRVRLKAGERVRLHTALMGLDESLRLKPGAQFKILTGNSMGPTTMPLEWNVKGAA